MWVFAFQDRLRPWMAEAEPAWMRVLRVLEGEYPQLRLGGA
jgi:hypothetical protein